ncbi:hypothetical protein [Jannaschia ovalis]|uniref:Uncharacterized protein n=1 Tax=Jannaschia ovalis TaxID=3038773 RepID=A0ABY8L886_9RHOB|nr:hypothetical protein [Jannaschia sp. GRR-S6-38]WGH77479.1 hypothetical protein P8627_10540 [Jannaschia sp. GRR-S6-38]
MTTAALHKTDVGHVPLFEGNYTVGGASQENFSEAGGGASDTLLGSERSDHGSWMLKAVTGAAVALYPGGVGAAATDPRWDSLPEERHTMAQPTLRWHISMPSYDGASQRSDVVEALKELRDLGRPVEMRRAVAQVSEAWEAAIGEDPVIEDLGDGSVLLHLLPHKNAGGASLEMLHDGRMVYNVMTSDGRSVGSGVLDTPRGSDAVSVLLQTASKAGVNLRA